jgi:hypothetical protein
MGILAYPVPASARERQRLASASVPAVSAAGSKTVQSISRSPVCQLSSLGVR